MPFQLWTEKAKLERLRRDGDEKPQKCTSNKIVVTPHQEKAENEKQNRDKKQDQETTKLNENLSSSTRTGA
jgi:hypothetical protein